MLEQLYSTMKELKAQYEASQKVWDTARSDFKDLPVRKNLRALLRCLIAVVSSNACLQSLLSSRSQHSRTLLPLPLSTPLHSILLTACKAHEHSWMAHTHTVHDNTSTAIAQDTAEAAAHSAAAVQRMRAQLTEHQQALTAAQDTMRAAAAAATRAEERCEELARDLRTEQEARQVHSYPSRSLAQALTIGRVQKGVTSRREKVMATRPSA